MYIYIGVTLGLHGASPLCHVLGWSFLEPPNDRDFEGYPLAVALLVDISVSSLQNVFSMECVLIECVL